MLLFRQTNMVKYTYARIQRARARPPRVVFQQFPNERLRMRLKPNRGDLRRYYLAGTTSSPMAPGSAIRKRGFHLKDRS